MNSLNNTPLAYQDNFTPKALLGQRQNQTILSSNIYPVTTSSWFAYVTSQLDQFEEKLAISRQAREQVTKRFILTDTDPETGLTRTYQVTHELISTSATNNESPLTDDLGGDEYVS